MREKWKDIVLPGDGQRKKKKKKEKEGKWCQERQKKNLLTTVSASTKPSAIPDWLNTMAMEVDTARSFSANQD